MCHELGRVWLDDSSVLHSVTGGHTAIWRAQDGFTSITNTLVGIAGGLGTAGAMALPTWWFQRSWSSFLAALRASVPVIKAEAPRLLWPGLESYTASHLSTSYWLKQLQAHSNSSRENIDSITPARSMRGEFNKLQSGFETTKPYFRRLSSIPSSNIYSTKFCSFLIPEMVQFYEIIWL